MYRQFSWNSTQTLTGLVILPAQDPQKPLNSDCIFQISAMQPPTHDLPNAINSGFKKMIKVNQTKILLKKYDIMLLQLFEITFAFNIRVKPQCRRYKKRKMRFCRFRRLMESYLVKFQIPLLQGPLK